VLTEKERLQIEELEKNYRDRSVKCPQCGEYMADLGLDFKSPGKSAENEWKIIKGLYTIGRSFYSCGCNGIGYIPQHPLDYQIYLNNILQEYENSIAYYQNKTIKEYPDKTERITYWSQNAATVKAEIAKQKSER